MQRFGEKLRFLREGKGMTQRYLAKQMGITSAFISDIEHKRKRPNLTFVMHIADMFGVTVDSLVWDTLELEFLDDA
jgi:transcriptional regulator with XRE-family HTH domain